MEQVRETSEAEEIEKSLNKAIWVLVGSSLYFGASIWFIFRSVKKADWMLIALGVICLAMAIIGIFRWSFRIKEIVRGLLN